MRPITYAQDEIDEAEAKRGDLLESGDAENMLDALLRLADMKGE